VSFTLDRYGTCSRDQDDQLMVGLSGLMIDHAPIRLGDDPAQVVPLRR
jgi:hypothetical protein